MQEIAWNVLDFYAPICCDSTSLWGTSDDWGSLQQRGTHPIRLSVPSPVSSCPFSTHLSGELICVRRMKRSECGGGWLRAGNFSPSCFHFQSQCSLSIMPMFCLCSENFEHPIVAIKSTFHRLSRLKDPKTQRNRQLMSLCEKCWICLFYCHHMWICLPRCAIKSTQSKVRSLWGLWHSLMKSFFI